MFFYILLFKTYIKQSISFYFSSSVFNQSGIFIQSSHNSVFISGFGSCFDSVFILGFDSCFGSVFDSIFDSCFGLDSFFLTAVFIFFTSNFSSFTFSGTDSLIFSSEKLHFNQSGILSFLDLDDFSSTFSSEKLHFNQSGILSSSSLDGFSSTIASTSGSS
jgi:hypothetical protein